MSDLTIKPIWDDAVELPEFSQPARDLTADVVVVGAGITGITTALLLAQAGVSVALVERRSVGGFDTGCTTAHLTAVADTPLAALVRSLGRDHAQAVWDAGLAGISEIERLVRSLGIVCDFARVPGLRHAPFDAGPDDASAAVSELRGEAAIARELGFDVEMLSATPLVGRPGWRIEDQALFHPRKYLRGLLDALGRAPRVTCLSGEAVVGDDPDRVTVAGHAIHTGTVVFATHTPHAGRLNGAAAGLLQSALALYTTYALAATVSRPAETPRACYWDTTEPYRYMRVDADGEQLTFIVGGEDHKTGQDPDTRARFAALERWFLALVPTATVTHRWSGQVIETPDRLPFIGEVSDGQYVATGFGGNGMTFGTLAAMMIRDAITGQRNPWQALFDVGRSAIARGPLDYLRENADYPYYMLRDRVAGVESRPLRAVRRGEGRLVEINGDVVAASRDGEGTLTLLTPTCTHLGCRVAWNGAEKTWDCPCHGSRFSDTGDVLAGPADSPLQPWRAPQAAGRTAS
jgi:glycine/D-amino acid oxidase-like deaminating enzyme/nitrite reductase/ring-hydroxylating ferredoxin subunit